MWQSAYFDASRQSRQGERGTQKVRTHLKLTVMTALTLTVAATAGGQTLLQTGEFRTATLATGKTDLYDFAATADDRITIEFAETVSSSELLCIRAVDAQGREVKAKICLNTTPTNTVSRDFRVFRSQIHKLEVSARGGQSMSYKVRISSCLGVCTAAPSDPPKYLDDQLTFQQPRSGILLESEPYALKIPLATGDIIRAEMSERIPGGINPRPCVRLAKPGERDLLSCSSATSRLEQKISLGGDYTLTFEDQNAAALAYRASISCEGQCKVDPQPPPPPPSSLTYGVPFEGVIRPGSGAARLFFDAAAGDYVSVNWSEVAPLTSAQPCVTIRGPLGVQLYSHCTSTSYSAPVRIDTSGRQSLEIYELGNDNALFYRVVLACTGTCAASNGGGAPPISPARISAEPSQLELVARRGQRETITAVVQLAGVNLDGLVNIQSTHPWLKPLQRSVTLPAEVTVEITPSVVDEQGASALIEVSSQSNPGVKLSIPVALDLADSKPAIYPQNIVLTDGQTAPLIVAGSTDQPQLTYLTKRPGEQVRLVKGSVGATTTPDESAAAIQSGAVRTSHTGTITATINGKAVFAGVTVRSKEAAVIEPVTQTIDFSGPEGLQFGERQVYIHNPTTKDVWVDISKNQGWITLVSPDKQFLLRSAQTEAIKVQVTSAGRTESGEGRLDVSWWPTEVDRSKALSRQVIVKLNVSLTALAHDVTVRPSGILLTGTPGEAPTCEALGAPAIGCSIELVNNGSQDRSFVLSSSPLLTFGEAKGVVPQIKNDKTVPKKIGITPKAIPLGTPPGLTTSQVQIDLSAKDEKWSTKLDIHMLVLPGETFETLSACVARDLKIIPVAGGREFVVPRGTSATLDVMVVDNCGRFLTDGAVFAFDSVKKTSVALRSHGNGRWQGSLNPLVSEGGRVSLEYRASSPDGEIRGSARQDALMESDDKTPVLDGVRIADKSVSANTLVPGALATVTGFNFANSESVASRARWSETLGGIEVLVAGLRAQIGRVSSGRIEFQVPFNAPVEALADLIVVRDGRHSSPMEVTLAESDPEIIAIMNGKGELLTGDRSVASLPGETVTIRATGLGMPRSEMLSGLPATKPGNAPRCEVAVLIGDRQLTPTAVEASTGEIGIYRIEAAVPGELSGAVPVILRCGEIPSNEERLRIQP